MSNILAGPLGALALVIAVATPPLSLSAQRLKPAALAPSAMISTDASAPSMTSPPSVFGRSENRRDHAVKGGMIGFVVGVVGTTFALWNDGRGESDSWALGFAPLLAPIGGLVGAGAGAIVGALWWEPPKLAPAK